MKLKFVDLLTNYSIVKDVQTGTLKSSMHSLTEVYNTDNKTSGGIQEESMLRTWKETF